MVAGMILCSFSFISHEDFNSLQKSFVTKERIFGGFKKKKKYLKGTVYPKTQKFIMRLNILGMRGLKSLGILPVKRAYIRIDLNMLMAKKDEDEIKEEVPNDPSSKGKKKKSKKMARVYQTQPK